MGIESLFSNRKESQKLTAKIYSRTNMPQERVDPKTRWLSTMHDIDTREIPPTSPYTIRSLS